MLRDASIATLHALFTAGELTAARATAEAIPCGDPRYAEALHILGLIAYRQERLTDAIALLRRSLAVAQQPETWSNLGAALRADGQLDAGEMAYRQALSLQPDLPAAWRNLGNLLVSASRLAEADVVLHEALRRHPRMVDLRRQLAGVLQIRGQHAAAARHWRDVLAGARADTDAALNLAKCLLATDDLPAAEQAFASYLVMAPAPAAAWAEHSDILRRLGRMAAAEASARRALAMDAHLAAAAVNLGNALDGQQRHTEVEAAFELALSLQADCAEALSGRGLAKLRRGAPAAAEADFRRALQVRPDLHIIGTNLGIALLDQGRPDEALVAMHAARQCNPEVAATWRALLFGLNYHPTLSADAIRAEYSAWGDRQKPAAPAIRRPLAGRLRVGYVSPDFRAQSASFFIAPLLAAHDRRVVEVFCYAELPHSDDTTLQLRTLADHWRPTVGLSDESLADLIRQDAIDVLVDMGGYGTHSRIGVFTHKPAPVQIEYLLGHGATSGLTTIDAFLADAHLVPSGCDHLFSETVVRLDRIPLAYAPPPGIPDVAPLPEWTRGHVTFGHFGRLARIHDGVVAAWSNILHAVPGARLMLNSAPFSEPAVQTLFIERFARHGIDADRLDLVYTHPQSATLHAYGGIDIALDPYPHNAGTTTIEALWMGVPVVSLADRPPVGRFGASILHAIGLDDWITYEPTTYVARAIAAARDLDALAALRSTLRDRCQASPLADAVELARRLEATYWTLREAAAR